MQTPLESILKNRSYAIDLVVFNPPKLHTTQMILFAEFLYATLFINSVDQQIITVKKN